jgi:hypothetical protein
MMSGPKAVRLAVVRMRIGAVNEVADLPNLSIADLNQMTRKAGFTIDTAE